MCVCVCVGGGGVSKVLDDFVEHYQLVFFHSGLKQFIFQVFKYCCHSAYMYWCCIISCKLRTNRADSSKVSTLNVLISLHGSNLLVCFIDYENLTDLSTMKT